MSSTGLRSDSGDDAHNNDGIIVNGPNGVQRWRRRLDDDPEYGYQQLREISRILIQELYKSPATKSPEEFMSTLVDEEFEGWSLEWERRVSDLCHREGLTWEEIKYMFLDVIPFGASPAYYTLAASSQVTIRKSFKPQTDPTIRDGPFVYEIMDPYDSICLRLFQTSKRDYWRGHHLTFVGKDGKGKEVLKLVWIWSIFPFRRCVKVYCPPPCFIGVVSPKWTWAEGWHLGIMSPFQKFTLGKVTPAVNGQNGWIGHEVNVRNDVTLYNKGPLGQIHGEWLTGKKEPKLVVTFPAFPVGMLTKVMTLVAGLVIFDHAFKGRLMGTVHPMSAEYQLELERKAKGKRRRRRLARVH